MSRTRILIALAVASIVVALLAIPAVVSAAGPVTVTINPQNNSGESGTATLTDLGNGQTKVDVSVNGEPAGASQPEHIHMGTCSNLNPAPAYPLNTLVNGKSTTTVAVSLSTLQSGQFAINGHKSAQDLSTYVFCGDISASAAPAAVPVTGGSFATWPFVALGLLGLILFTSGWLVLRLAHRDV